MPAIELTEADDGTSIEVDVGDTILLRLEDNPTTGYQFELEHLVGESVVVDESAHEPSNGTVGSGGVATWAMRAVAPGTTTVALKRWRPWEGEASVLARFSVGIHAHL